jgi:hypothetical protein
MTSAEKSYKNFTAFIMNIMNTGISILKILIKSQFGLHLPKATTSSCIILGNGPSLKQSLTKHPDFFTKHSLVCVNNFALSEEYFKLKPEYYVFLDPGYWLGNSEPVKNTLLAISQTTWKLQVFAPQKARNSTFFQNAIRANSNIEVHYFNYTVFKGFDGLAHFFFNKNLAMPQSQNVLVASLFVTINIAFKNIYIVGADHTWHENMHVNYDNQLCIKDQHFYDNEQHITYRPFYKDEHQSETFRIYEVMTALGKTFYGYEILRKYAENNNAVIYNASEISFIDAFKRIKL